MSVNKLNTRDIGFIKEGWIYYPFLNTKRRDAPEERVRLQVLRELILKYKYPKNRIEIEFPVPRRKPEDQADVVIFEDDQKTKAYIVFELKTPNCSPREKEQAVEQAFGNGVPLGAKFVVFHCGNEEDKRVFVVTVNRLLERKDNLVSDIPVHYGKIPEYKFKRGDKIWDLKPVSLNTLSSIFHQCHTALWGSGENDPIPAFDEMSKILFAKLYDERYTKIGGFYKFQKGTNENEETIAERVIELYETARKADPYVFEEPVRVESKKILEIVKLLQSISLRLTDLDAKGRAYERFLGSIFRGPAGQYFTPREIIDFMVRMVKPNVNSLVIDPACGSGGFLLYCLNYVREEIQRSYEGDVEALFEFANHRLYGVEKNERIARVAMMDMIVHGDGHSNIEHGDGLRAYELYDRKIINKGKFDIALTNPPLSTRSYETSQNILKNFELGSKIERKLKQRLSILFIERCLELLKPKGKIGIVLDDGLLKNSTLRYVREFILSKGKVVAIVSVPKHTFVPSGADVKASLVFVEKHVRPSEDDYVFMASVDHVGFDSTGRPDRNDLRIVLKEFAKFLKDPSTCRPRKEEDRIVTYALKYEYLQDRLDYEYYHPAFLGEIEKIENSRFRVTNLRELCVKIFTGKTFKRDQYKDKSEIYTVFNIKTTNLTNDGIDWYRKSHTGSYTGESSYEKHADARVEPGDILLNCSAHNIEYVGRYIDIIDISETVPSGVGNRILCSGEVMVIRPRTSKIDPVYLLFFLRSKLGQLQIRRIITGQSAHLYPEDMMNLFRVIIPPIPKQKEVSKRLKEITDERKRLLSQAERIKHETTRIFDEVVA